MVEARARNDWIDCRTVSSQATLVIDMRVGAMGRVESASTSPQSSDQGEPSEGCPFVRAPDRISRQAVDSAIGGIYTIELDAEDEVHVLIVSLDMNNVANGTEGLADALDGSKHLAMVIVGELPDSVIWIGVNLDRELDLSIELVELSGVLRLGDGVAITRDVVDGELVLLENVLAFSSVTEIVVTKVDATGVDWHTVGEACVLDERWQGQGKKRKRGRLTNFIMCWTA
jgi:hypothetical protein